MEEIDFYHASRLAGEVVGVSAGSRNRVEAELYQVSRLAGDVVDRRARRTSASN